MSCWAVIPVKPTGDGKTRLAEVLNSGERAALIDAMLARVLSAATSARNIDRVCLIGADRSDRFDEVLRLEDPGGGLNAAVAHALDAVASRGAARVIFVHADLPAVSARDLELLAAAPAEEIAIAPDRHGTGTNAISLPLPAARGFSFAFGPDSFARHKAEADRIGLKVEEVRSPGLARDIDEPADLPDAQSMLKRPG